jgi:Ni,Fe-hydrogenase III small subunit/formate hydrogenlyase subunit 6/NADH:ubiquinone oxidoreductase subunit I
MLRILVNALRTGVVTTRYPAERSVPPDRFRGAPVLRPGSRLPPPAVCPSGALSEHFDERGRHVALDLARCVFCGRCAEDPWQGAVTMGRDFELAARSRDDLRIEVVADDPGDGFKTRSRVAANGAAPPSAEAVARDRLCVGRALGGAVRGQDPPEGFETASAVPMTRPASDLSAVALAEADRDADAARASSEIHRVLGRSLHLRHLDAGSCNACDWELAALLNPVYDVRRLGVDFVASPRHADGVVVTGSVTRNLETAVRRTVEAIPDPRIVIAVGACAASGGIVGEGYASAGGVDRVLPVDVYIPGCPPRPEAIIFGILVAVGRLDVRRSPRDA